MKEPTMLPAAEAKFIVRSVAISGTIPNGEYYCAGTKALPTITGYKPVAVADYYIVTGGTRVTISRAWINGNNIEWVLLRVVATTKATAVSGNFGILYVPTRLADVSISHG